MLSKGDGPMKIVLTSVDTGLTKAWQQFCGDLKHVTVHHGSIFDVACDAVVSPTNSRGLMTGGIDALYLRQFGRKVQDRLSLAILQRHHGKLPVGETDCGNRRSTDRVPDCRTDNGFTDGVGHENEE